MLKHLFGRESQPARSVNRPSSSRNPFRSARFEPLEERRLLAAPQLDAPDSVILSAGAPLHIVLDGFDADGDTLSYSVTSDNPKLAAYVPEGNRSLRISVEDFGEMEFELFETRAPRTTARIIELAESGFYDDLTFHRIIEDFMIQGGDPWGTGSGGSGVDFDDEFHVELQHTSSGLLSMANSGPDTNDSQFFITSEPTRWLDFDHAIFGFLTAGDDVREAIESVEKKSDDPNDSDSSVPVEPVVMSSVEVFTDLENGVLVLTAPEGTFDVANVTVTVSDGETTVDHTIQVNIWPDNQNTEPFLLPIEDIHTTVDVPVDVFFDAVDVEWDPVTYQGVVSPANPNLAIDVSPDDGDVTVTPSNGIVGVYGIQAKVSRSGNPEVDDTQAVPVFIHPAAPSKIELLGSSDTGPDDGITNPDNTTTGSLKFQVFGVLQGAVVTLYANGQEIGEATVTGQALPADSVVIDAQDSAQLIDGPYSITAVQALENQPVNVGNRTDTVDLASEVSAPIVITIDSITPQFVSTPIETADLGALYTYDAETDEEPSGLVRYRLTESPPGMSINKATGEITWTPQPDHGPIGSVAVAATDAAGNERQQEFTIEVRNAPIFDPIGDKQIDEGELLTFTASATDPEYPNATLRYSLAVPAPAGATIDPDTGVFRWTPGEAQGPGDYSITLRVVHEAQGTQGTKTFTVHVNEVNTAPEIVPIPDQRIDEEQPLEFVVGVDDPDLPEDGLTFSLVEAPSGAVINQTTGRFSFTPDETQGGQSFVVTIRVADDDGAADEKSFNVTVDEVDHPPVITPIDRQFVSRGDDLRLTVEAIDPDVPANPIVYTLADGASEGAAIDRDSGLLTWHVPENGTAASYRLVVEATEMIDGQPGLSSQIEVEISVFDPRAIALAEAMISQRPSMTPITPEVSDALLSMLMSPDASSGGSAPSMAPMPSSGGTVEDELFGYQIGPRTSLGGGVRSASPQEGPEGPEQPDEMDEEKDGDDEISRSDSNAPAANDAILAWLAEPR